MSKNAINWFEIPVSDLARATNFYESLLQVTLSQESMNGMDMAIFPYSEGTVTGALVSAPFLSPSNIGSVVYLNAEGMFDEALARAVEHGAEVALPKMDIGPNGVIAHIIDTEGNRVGLHSMT
ncbi:MAG: VOC family protein [Granulosicoccus sp.]